GHVTGNVRHEVERVPDGLMVNGESGTGHEDADETRRHHANRQPDGLTDDLLALAGGKTGKIGDVETQCRPVADVRGEAGPEQLPERVVRAAAHLAGRFQWGPK